jgi:hypothetical protein
VLGAKLGSGRISGRSPKNALIDEIESALRTGAGDKRTKILMRVTDLFVDAAPKYSELQTKLFDEVLVHLIQRVESSALARIAARLAPIPNAPVDTIRHLARNDAVTISGPVLKNSVRLDDSDLIEIAKTKSQAHLANIAQRPRINAAVTDVLVDHGDADVANAVAVNSGAQCSNLTIAKLVMRADGDDRLADSISRRNDLSPHMLRQLLTQATEAVRVKLLASAKPEQKDTIKQMIDGISTQVEKSLLVSRNYARAEQVFMSVSQDINLARAAIMEYADTNRVEEVIVGLSSISGISIDQVDRLFYAPTYFGLMILCKASALTWKTTYAVIKSRGVNLDSQISPQTELCQEFKDLSISSAQTIIHFWQGRQKVIQAIANRTR